MDGKQFVETALRDAQVVDAIHCAIYAMTVINGSKVTQGDVSGILHFEPEIAALRRALQLLGIGTEEQFPARRRIGRR
jgi:hypothetical protein